VHRYTFELLALDVENVNLMGAFDGRQALAAVGPHIIARATHGGAYAMNPELKG
jgi:phosphatidylethanolamine-binding protein (PEBP) family uncharacterized protein